MLCSSPSKNDYPNCRGPSKSFLLRRTVLNISSNTKSSSSWEMRRWRELLEQKGQSDLRAHHEAATGQNPAGPLLKMMGTMVGSSTGIIYREESLGELRLWRCKATLLRCDDTKTQGQNGDLSQPWHELPHGQSTISTPSSLHTPPSPSFFAPTLISSASQAPDPCGSEPALRLRLSPDQSLADRSLFVPKL